MRSLIGIALLAAVLNGIAVANSGIQCQPVVIDKPEPCEPVLGVYLKRGYIPNRCRVS